MTEEKTTRLVEPSRGRTEKKTKKIGKKKILRKLRSPQFLIGVLALLIIVSGIQSFQLVALKKSLKNEVIKPAGATSIPASLENVPDMVGGC